MTATRPDVATFDTAETAAHSPRRVDETIPSDAALPPATGRDRALLAALLVTTAVLYLWNITINGDGNTFYAGAAWAGSRNWEALLFGSVDPANFITVDKPPVSQWVMGLSGQIFGYSSAAMLIPEALMGVAAVALMYAMVARIGGRPAGLLAGFALAVTPVAAMMFRFNNPDAAMVLLMTAAAYCTMRATARGSMRWLALAGVALGFAFLAKMLEGLMVLPALGVVYLLAAPVPFWRRVGHLLVAAVALAVSAGWYVVLTLLWPASSRPYLAGSTDNNFMNLVIGYNGLDRVQGRSGGAGAHGGSSAMTDFMRENPSVADRFGGHGGGGRGFGGMFGSGPGITRLFTGEFGGEISFLLPTALVALIVLLALRGRRPRTDLVRAGAVLFGLWLLVDGLLLSYMGGTAHPYYSLAIAPPIAGLVGLGVYQSWCAREDLVSWRRYTARGGLAAMIAAAGIWSFVLLDRQPGWQPWLRWVVLGTAVVAAVLVLVPGRFGRRVAVAAGILGFIGVFAAPAAYAITGDTVAHTGGSPSVLPDRGSPTGHIASTAGASRAGGVGAGGMGGSGFGGGATRVPAQLESMLQGSHARWAAAVSRTATASGVELAARVPVMGIGGFSGDPAPSLAQFQKYVADKDVGYYLASDGAGGGRGASGGAGADAAVAEMFAAHGFGGGRSSVTTQIQQWVQANFHGTTIGDYTVYDLGVAPSPQPTTTQPTTTQPTTTQPTTTQPAPAAHTSGRSTNRGTTPTGRPGGRSGRHHITPGSTDNPRPVVAG
ncbi:ArnT family glycosyltransferase [Gordonia sp. DT30]|uniref:ArnT family glycosyltransferase n=1 Tax=unclassified Gordonia (in: high G+C Gram-positive bacteria) TaxID=2657482 RepID=UPI003CF87856